MLAFKVVLGGRVAAHSSPGAIVSLADLEMKAPTRSEIRAISIRWKDVNPWMAALSAEAVVLAVEKPGCTELRLF